MIPDDEIVVTTMSLSELDAATNGLYRWFKAQGINSYEGLLILSNAIALVVADQKTAERVNDLLEGVTSFIGETARVAFREPKTKLIEN